MLKQSIVLGAGTIVAVAGCITVNIYFPAPEVRLAAEAIVEETWGEGAERPPAGSPERGPAAGTPRSSWLGVLLPSVAQAQEADINVSTAAIRALRESIRLRAGQLKPWLGSGNVGIGSDGLLVVRALDGVALRDQATIRRLVEAENRDRRSLYAEIAKANKFGDERIPEIQRIFAETWIDRAEAGWWVQASDGSWKRR